MSVPTFRTHKTAYVPPSPKEAAKQHAINNRKQPREMARRIRKPMGQSR